MAPSVKIRWLGRQPLKRWNWSSFQKGIKKAQPPRYSGLSSVLQYMDSVQSRPPSLTPFSSFPAQQLRDTSRTRLNRRKLKREGSSLAVQGMRICLPTQGTQLWSLGREDPICCGTTKPACHNYWARALQPGSHKCSSLALQHRGYALQQRRRHNEKEAREPLGSTVPLAAAREKPAQQWRPSTAKNKTNSN